MPTIILCHQLHNQNQISADSVLAQPFATLINAITVKWLPNGRHGLKCKQAKSQNTRQEDVIKLIKHGLDQAKFPSTLEPIS